MTVASLEFSTTTTPAAATSLTLTPTADAYVQSDRATTNFGTATQLSADASPITRILLKFTVSGVNGRPVLNAKLRLRCVNGSNIGGALHRVTDSSWAENTLPWSNQPPADTATIAALGPVSANTTYEINLGALITGDGTYTIAIDSTSNDGAYYSSKEGTNAPELLLTLAPDALFADGFESGGTATWSGKHP